MKICNSGLFILILFLCFPFFSCHRNLPGAAQTPKNIEKMQEERKKETEEQYQLALKRHKDIQTKETRKRMKQSRKTSERLIEGKPKDSFFKRLFSKKLKKSKPKPTKT